MKTITTSEPPDRARNESEALLRALLDSVKDHAVFRLDANGVVAGWNDGARRLKGYRAGEIVGRRVSVFYTPADRRRGLPGQLLKRAAAQGSVEDWGWRVRKDGTRFLALVKITAIKDPAGKLRGFVKVTRDTTGSCALAAANLARGLLAGEEAERRRCARELHDGVNQRLVAAKLLLQGVAGRLGPNDAARPPVSGARRLIAEAIGEVRRVSRALGPPVLYDLGLEAALRSLGAEFQRRTGIAVRVAIRRWPAALAADVELALFRIVQEALNNVARHSGARRAAVSLTRGAKALRIAVRDNGQGFSPDAGGARLGTIRERALLLGGGCEARNARGGGARVVVSVPLGR